MKPRHPPRIRMRLTLRFAALSGGILALCLAAVGGLQFWQMRVVVQRLAIEDIETVEGLLYITPGGGVGVREDYHTHGQWRQAEQRYVEVLAPNGTVLFRNPRLGTRYLGGAPFPGEGVGGYSPRTGRLSDGTRAVLVSRRHALAGRMLLLRLGYPLSLVWSQWRDSVSLLLLVLPLGLLVTGWAAYRMAGMAFDPIAAITRHAERINSQRLHERLPVGNEHDELGRLSCVINDMLNRIEAAFERLRRFSADAAHELRTPLASLRSVGEVGLQRDATADQYRDTIGSMLEEIGRMTELVEGLLALARADAGRIVMHFDSCGAMDLLREVGAMLEVLMQEKSIQFEISGDREASICCDRLYLRQALINVLHNAIRFTPRGGQIAAKVERSGAALVNVVVSDSGPGIATADAERIFERFYRGARTAGQRTGAGLGLAIANWAVQAQGGSIAVVDPGHPGCRIRMQIPAAGA